jgi:hypothetical protein
VPITVTGPPVKIGSIAVDHRATANGNGSVSVAGFSTGARGEVLLAFVGSDGPLTGQTATVTGGGLTWKLVRRANGNGGDTEVWSATANSRVSNVAITATASKPGFDLTLTTIGLTGASGIGASAAAGAARGAPTIRLTTAAAGSALFASGNDWTRSVARTLGAGQRLLSQNLDAGTGDTYWTQYRSAPSASAGQSATLNDTAPTADRFNLAAVEVLAGTLPTDNQRPTVRSSTLKPPRPSPAPSR